MEEKYMKLIQAAQNGNSEAFRQLVEIYKAYVFAICFNILRDKDEAENMAQEAFIEVYRSLKSYEFRGFKTWMGRIAANKCIDYKRKMKKKLIHEVNIEDENLYIIADDKPIIEKIIENEDKERLRNILYTLPEVYISTIKKYYMQGKTYEEIAREENVSIKTVESRLYRGRKILREKWEEEENETL